MSRPEWVDRKQRNDFVTICCLSGITRRANNARQFKHKLCSMGQLSIWQCKLEKYIQEDMYTALSDPTVALLIITAADDFLQAFFSALSLKISMLRSFFCRF